MVIFKTEKNLHLRTLTQTLLRSSKRLIWLSSIGIVNSQFVYLVEELVASYKFGVFCCLYELSRRKLSGRVRISYDTAQWVNNGSSSHIVGRDYLAEIYFLRVQLAMPSRRKHEWAWFSLVEFSCYWFGGLTRRCRANNKCQVQATFMGNIHWSLRQNKALPLEFAQVVKRSSWLLESSKSTDFLSSIVAVKWTFQFNR